MYAKHSTPACVKFLHKHPIPLYEVLIWDHLNQIVFNEPSAEVKNFYVKLWKKNDHDALATEM